MRLIDLDAFEEANAKKWEIGGKEIQFYSVSYLESMARVEAVPFAVIDDTIREYRKFADELRNAGREDRADIVIGAIIMLKIMIARTTEEAKKEETVEAIPVEWIKQWNDRAWCDNQAMHGWFDRMLWDWAKEQEG